NMRSRKQSIFSIGLFGNRWLTAAILIGFVLQVSVISLPFLTNIFGVHPLKLWEYALLTGISSLPLWVHEVIKLFRNKGRKET
ncbi:MAG TPA: hypothetical protein DD727_02260, partial [Clostridiales bacterium]|nr:hypothetical protein [Clostridiales bacterium]